MLHAGSAMRDGRILRFAEADTDSLISMAMNASDEDG